MQFHPTPGSIRSSQLHKMYQSRCTAKNSWWWAERLPETCRVVTPIKLEFGASVGFIHKETLTMHSHTIVKHQWMFHLNFIHVEKQSTPITGVERPWGFQGVEVARFQDNQHMEVVRLSALATGAFAPRKYTWYSFLFESESHYVNEEIQRHRRESNPRPLGLYRSASTNCTISHALIHVYYKGEFRRFFNYLLVVCVTSALKVLLCKERKYFKNTRISQWFTWNNQVFTHRSSLISKSRGDNRANVPELLRCSYISPHVPCSNKE